MSGLKRQISAKFEFQMTEMQPYLKAFARKLTRNIDQADDLLQDTNEKIWKNGHKFQQGTNFKAWAFTIMMNTFRSDIRKEKSRRKMAQLLTQAWSEATSHMPHQLAKIELDEVLRAMETLPAEQRECLEAVRFAGCSYMEAAAQQKTAIGTVKSRVNRGTASLKAKLGG